MDQELTPGDIERKRTEMEMKVRETIRETFPAIPDDLVLRAPIAPDGSTITVSTDQLGRMCTDRARVGEGYLRVVSQLNDMRRKDLALRLTEVLREHLPASIGLRETGDPYLWDLRDSANVGAGEPALRFTLRLEG
jgi:hypothetical protein